jgi:hypothetical protein
MQYLLMLHFPPGKGPQEGAPEFDAEMRRWGELNAEMREAGASASRAPTAPTTRTGRPSARPIATPSCASAAAPRSP